MIAKVDTRVWKRGRRLLDSRFGSNFYSRANPLRKWKLLPAAVLEAFPCGDKAGKEGFDPKATVTLIFPES